MLIQFKIERANFIGLEPSIGFLHDFSDYQTKQSLVYDLQEPFRWLIDVTVIEAFESKTLDLRDFYFTGDDYRYRFDAEAKSRFINLLREQFNSGANYKGHLMKWDTTFEQKVNELARFLTGRSRVLSFLEPCPVLERADDLTLRKQILSLSQEEANKLTIGKSTLCYLRKRAEDCRTFKLYRPIRAKLGC